MTWVGPAWSRRALASLPWIRGILANARTACFAELLSLLVENDVPLHQAIVLAGEASPDEKMARGARVIAGAIERGESAATAVSDSKEFPPLLRWLLVAGLERGAWVQALRHASATYRELAQHQASMLRQVLPVVLLLAIGGTAVLIYGLSVFVPFSALLKDLSVF